METEKQDTNLPALGRAQPVNLEVETVTRSGGASAASENFSKEKIASHGPFEDRIDRHGDIPVIRNAKGFPVWCPATAIALLQYHPDWLGCLRHDAFLQGDMLYRPVPGAVETEGFETREIKDTDIVQAQVWFNRNGFPDATRNTVADAFQAVAAANVIDPIKDWLLALHWDGRRRLSS